MEFDSIFVYFYKNGIHMIPRRIEQEAKLALTQFRALCITGPRQSGKTTLSKQLATGKAYVNFENPQTQLAAEENLLTFLSQYTEGAIFDEVQRVPLVFRYLQEVLDNNPARGQFILTGSNNFLLQEQVSQSLAGRAGYLTLLPLSYAELKQAGKAQSTISTHIIKGGYPEIWQENLLPEKWLASYLQTYVQRDVRLLRNITNLAAFNRFIYLCANFAGQIVNRDDLAKKTGIDTKTAQAWLGLLEKSFVIFQLQPYYNNLNKRIVKSPKLYFYDTGLLCYLLGIHTETALVKSETYGAVFENWIISEIRKNRYNEGTQGGMYYFRDNIGNEIDLVIDRQGEPLAVEVKATKKPNSEDFKGLKFWNKLQPNSATLLIHGGNTSQTESHVMSSIPWHEVDNVE